MASWLFAKYVIVCLGLGLIILALHQVTGLWLYRRREHAALRAMSIGALADEARRRATARSLDACFPAARIFDRDATADAASLIEAIEQLVRLAAEDDQLNNRLGGPGSRTFDCYDGEVVAIRDFLQRAP